MAKDIFGGLMKSFGAFMPKDDPDIKAFQAQTEITDLENREQELYAEIGKKEFPRIQDNPEYSTLVQELVTLQKNLQTARFELQRVQSEKAEKDLLEKEGLLSRTCSNCDFLNPEGVKFCQECGSSLGKANKIKCPNCNTDYPPGTRFCGECGNQL